MIGKHMKKVVLGDLDIGPFVDLIVRTAIHAEVSFLLQDIVIVDATLGFDVRLIAIGVHLGRGGDFISGLVGGFDGVVGFGFLGARGFGGGFLGGSDGVGGGGGGFGFDGGFGFGVVGCGCGAVGGVSEVVVCVFWFCARERNTRCLHACA